MSSAIHDALVADGHTIVSAPIDGPLGRTFTFADPDGYQVTLHDRFLISQTPPDDHRSPTTAVAPRLESSRIEVCPVPPIPGCG